MGHFFETAAALTAGDSFVEQDGFGSEEYTVLTNPVIDPKGYQSRDGKFSRQVSWTATRLTDGVECDFLITEGMEHYGPKIYC